MFDRLRFAAAMLGLGLMVACSSEPADQAPPAPSAGGSATEHREAIQIYQRVRCDRCHGKDREGTPAAPPLINLGRFWTEDSLAAYLAHPESTVGISDRLDALAKRYQLVMPGYGALSDDERRALARYMIAE